MAFSYYMNMEVMSLENATEHVEKMTNSNTVDYDEYICDDEKLLNNLKNGWIVAISMCNYFESFLNTILRDCIHYDKENLMKASIDDKIEIIYLYYKKDFSNTKSKDGWAKFKELNKLRNNLIHYKINFLGYGTDVPPKWENKLNGFDLFTKNKMLDFINKICELAKDIAQDLHLIINDKVSTIICDGKDMNVSYVTTKIY